MRDSGREIRVADFVRDEVADILRSEVRDPRVSFVSINDVKVSRDLSFADVYVSSLEATDEDGKAALIKALNGAAGFVRSQLARRHSMRTTPKPRFHYDEVAANAARMDALISSALAEDRERAVQRGDVEFDAHEAAQSPPDGNSA
ncbi:MAG: 30S ribosome-binding factor RbfA [Pseudomonadota bacterium]